MLLHTPDWDTVVRVTDVINEVAPDTAVPENAGVVYIQTPTGLKQRANFIRLVTNLKVTPDLREARVFGRVDMRDDHANRSGLRSSNGADAGSPARHSPISFPLIGPRLNPIIAWPVATQRLSKAPERPRSGKPSWEQGRKPDHTSSLSRSAVANAGK